MNLRIYYKYLSSRIASKWTVLLVDVIIVVISMLSACFLQYRLSSVSYEISLYVWLTILAVLCNVCFFHILRTYVGVIRFSSFVDIYRVLWSLTISYAVLFLGNYCWSVSGLGETLPNSILFMAYMFTFSLMACMRIMKLLLLMHVIAWMFLFMDSMGLESMLQNPWELVVIIIIACVALFRTNLIW